MTEIWYRLNLFAEKRFFEKENLIDGIVVPAHLVAYYEIAMPVFLQELELPFLIDPVTYVWGIDRHFVMKEGRLKKSYAKLVSRLSCSGANLLGNQRIQAIKKDSVLFQDFIDCVLKFQLLGDDVKKAPRKDSIDRIRRFKREAEAEEAAHIEPYALIPPYFYFSNASNASNPYQKTAYAAEFAKNSDYGEKHKVYPCLCMDRTILTDQSQRNKIIEDFGDYPGVLLWIDNFDETTASLHELEGLANLVISFREAGTEPINLYGGYFSLALSHIGVSKLSCGICYSRYRNVRAPTGGGGLPIRYYEPHLKIKLLGDDIFRLYTKAPVLFNCNCPICSSYTEDFRNTQSRTGREESLNKFFGILDDTAQIVKGGVINWENSRYHFLYARKVEQEYTNRNELENVVSDLRDKHEILSRRIGNLGRLGLRVNSFEYLKLWADVLQNH